MIEFLPDQHPTPSHYRLGIGVDASLKGSGKSPIYDVIEHKLAKPEQPLEKEAKLILHCISPKELSRIF